MCWTDKLRELKLIQSIFYRRIKFSKGESHDSCFDPNLFDDCNMTEADKLNSTYNRFGDSSQGKGIMSPGQSQG